MRLLVYNIRYGTGGKRRLFPWSGYLYRTAHNLDDITAFIRGLSADVIGLVEVDAGSYRSSRLNQAATIARTLGHYHIYTSKYGTASMARRLPLLRKQGNAFLTHDRIHSQRFHYFRKGVKRLVIELELADVVIFLVHLAIGYRARQDQLGDLYGLVRRTRKPHIVAGDFNARWGDREIGLFMGATRLVNPNHTGKPTYPSWDPKRQLDFVLHSPDIVADCLQMPEITYSDHLPMVFDFHVAPHA